MVAETTAQKFRPSKQPPHQKPAFEQIKARLESQFLDRASEESCAEIWDHTQSLAQTIRQRREELEMPQSELAAKLGIRSSEFICLLEQGKRNLELNRIPRLAEILGLNKKSLCRLALFESAPQLAFSLFGGSIKNFVPAKAGNSENEAVSLSPEQASYLGKIYSLPSPLRCTVLNLIDQFVVLVRRGMPTLEEQAHDFRPERNPSPSNSA